MFLFTPCEGFSQLFAVFPAVSIFLIYPNNVCACVQFILVTAAPDGGNYKTIPEKLFACCPLLQSGSKGERKLSLCKTGRLQKPAAVRLQRFVKAGEMQPIHQGMVAQRCHRHAHAPAFPGIAAPGDAGVAILLLVLVSQQVIHRLYRIECSQRHFYKYRNSNKNAGKKFFFILSKF